jgi:formylglycine-generating enzyme required for sulfatase activity
MTPDLARVPAGPFLMGSERGRPDERPVRRVETTVFWMARTPVTRADYESFLADGRAEEPPWWRDAAFAAPDQPVVGITWFEAVAFGQWLSERRGGLWRLPTEAEWEKAARGGLVDAPTAWGADLPAGEIPAGPLEGPWPVGRGTPNGYGLFDMGTIVHEWCLDVYRGAGREDQVDVQAAAPVEGLRRSSRGGSWRHRVRWSSPSARSSLPPDFRYADYGFRVLREA